MKRNTELFDRIADEIEAHPLRYTQSWWCRPSRECESSYCISGWAAVLTGWSFVHPGGSPRVRRGCIERLAVDDASRAELGLDEDEAGSLFDAQWNPPPGESVPDALRRIGRGGAIGRGE